MAKQYTLTLTAQEMNYVINGLEAHSEELLDDIKNRDDELNDKRPKWLNDVYRLANKIQEVYS